MNEVNELLKALGKDTKLQPDEWTKEHIYTSGNKKWIANIVPAQLLKRDVKSAIESLMTLNENNIFLTYSLTTFKHLITEINGESMQTILKLIIEQ